jgi:predicted nucleic acid-binding protein
VCPLYIPAPTIQSAFERLVSVPSVTIEDAASVTRALDWFGQGMDFADALHLASSASAVTRLATFDRAFVKRARKLSATPRVELA